MAAAAASKRAVLSGTNARVSSKIVSQNSVSKNKSLLLEEKSSQKEKVKTAKIGIMIRSFDKSYSDSHLPPHTSKINLPDSRVLYTVLRSPHIDKKSREQFEMRMKKQYVVIETERDQLQKKLFWLKRMRLFGAQYEILLSCKTRLDMGKLQSIMAASTTTSDRALTE